MQPPGPPPRPSSPGPASLSRSHPVTTAPSRVGGATFLVRHQGDKQGPNHLTAVCPSIKRGRIGDRNSFCSCSPQLVEVRLRVWPGELWTFAQGLSSFGSPSLPRSLAPSHLGRRHPFCSTCLFTSNFTLQQGPEQRMTSAEDLGTSQKPAILPCAGVPHL